MTEHELFQKTFSTLHASPDTLTEVRKNMENNRKTHRTLRKGAVIAIAAALTLTVAAAAGAVHLIRADVTPADQVDDATQHAFTDDIDTAKPIMTDSTGHSITMPDMERIPGDAETTERLVGGYLSKLDASVQVGSRTITLDTFLIDENGMGIITYSVEDPDGVAYDTYGYGQIGGPDLYRCGPSSEEGGVSMFSRCYADSAASTDTCLRAVLYFAGNGYEKGDNIYLTLRDAEGAPTAIAIQPRIYVPVRTLTAADGMTVSVSPLGIAVPNHDPSGECVVNELILHFRDGSDFAVNSSQRSLMNWVVGCIRTGSDGDATTYLVTDHVFNRLVDTAEISSVELSGSWHGRDSEEPVAVQRTYLPE